MNRLRALFLTLAVALAGTSVTFAQDYFLHTVEKGQGLYSISRTYGITEDEIIKLNPGSESRIIAGQSLKIPRKNQDGSRNFHTVAPGETLYGLATSNNLTVKQICDANPGLSVETLRAGMVIAIPKADANTDAATAGNQATASPEGPVLKQVAGIRERKEYKSQIEVVKKVTIYRLCKDFNITEEEFLAANPKYRTERLRQGDIVNIPFNASEIEEREEEFRRQDQLLEEQARLAARVQDSIVESRRNRVNAALVLPLQLDNESSTEKAKMLEFTRGALLAVSRLKDEGISVNLKIIDSGSEGSSIEANLEALENVDVVIGPKWSGQISEAALWSSRKGIPLVLPFNKNADEVFSNPHIFQLNTPQSYFTQDIVDHFARQFRNPNIIVLQTGEGGTNSLIESLGNLANENRFPLHKLQVDTAAQAVIDCMDPSRQNVFIIDSPESGPLLTMLPVLQLINRTKDPEMQCCLFGYPEYQIYAADLLEQLCECDTWFYSWFYTNNLLQESVDFGNSFIQSFGRQMMVSYPSYAPYGYDTALYFLKGIAKYGKDFENNLDRIETDPVQMGFKFSRSSNWGGFINRKVFFVHFSNEFLVEKIDFDK